MTLSCTIISMSNDITFTALPAAAELTEAQATFARKIAIGSALFSTLDELNAIDVQPYVTTIHGEVARIVRTIVADAIGIVAFSSGVADAIVEHAYDSDLSTAARYVIECTFSSALERFREAQDGIREGWYTQNEYGNALAEYNDAHDLLVRTIGTVGA